MKKKSLFYLIVGIFGIVLIVLAIVLDGRVSNAVDSNGRSMGGHTSGYTIVGDTRCR